MIKITDEFINILDFMIKSNKESEINFMLCAYSRLSINKSLYDYCLYLSQVINDDSYPIIEWCNGYKQEPMYLIDSKMIKYKKHDEIVEIIKEKIIADFKKNNFDNKFYGLRDKEHNPLSPVELGYINISFSGKSNIVLKINY